MCIFTVGSMTTLLSTALVRRVEKELEPRPQEEVASPTRY
jgi:hypothetical protein